MLVSAPTRIIVHDTVHHISNTREGILFLFFVHENSKGLIMMDVFFSHADGYRKIRILKQSHIRRHYFIDI